MYTKRKQLTVQKPEGGVHNMMFGSNVRSHETKKNTQQVYA